eukprot:m.132468 g.132468  ORF g.132468 m.132468 type:complete len:140 (+) comp17500_c0_seq3:107-526(+)
MWSDSSGALDGLCAQGRSQDTQRRQSVPLAMTSNRTMLSGSNMELRRVPGRTGSAAQADKALELLLDSHIDKMTTKLDNFKTIYDSLLSECVSLLPEKNRDLVGKAYSFAADSVKDRLIESVRAETQKEMLQILRNYCK